MAKPQTTDPLFAGVDLPPAPVLDGQPEVINTRTLVIYGTGRGGGGGGLRVAAVRGGAGAPAPNLSPKLFALDKATGKELATVAIPAATAPCR